jgi:formate C-acetyltransferase
LVTEFFLREGFDESRPVLRQANVLRYVLEHQTPVIFDQELIVGSTTRRRLGMVVYPEFLALAIWPELPTMARRSVNPVAISDEDADYLANVVFPFWKDRTIIEHVRREGKNPGFLGLMERIVFFALTKAAGLTHLIPDYETLVRRGLSSLVAEAGEREKTARDEESAELYSAISVCGQGVIGLAHRYAAACDQEAGCCREPRAMELKEIARALRKVPAGPASTLQEALQSIWITQVALLQENSDMALSFGRLDQILSPYYESDLAEGRIDENQAGELIGCFFLKMGDHMPLAPLAGQEIIGGASTDQAVTIGGMKPDGADGVNGLTFLILKLSAMLALREPNLCARLHRDSPPAYVRAVVESLFRNGAAPALYGDEQVIKALTSSGVALPDARDYGIIGCVEPASAGRTMSMTGAIMFNLAAVLELALNDGIHPLSGLQIGPATGRFEGFQSFEEFDRAFQKQLDCMVDLATLGNSRFAQAHAKLHPTPLLSGLLRGSMESGKDVTRGGARYNSSGVGVIGFADVADSLTAIKHLVFEKGLLSPEELMSALAGNFDGHEKTFALLTRKAPKYGTDDPVADQVAAELVKAVAASFGRHQNPRGGKYHVGFWSLTMHTGLGALTGALPNGKRKGAPLASGVTPVSGVARKGPTAAFASTTKLPADRIANGMANNHKLPRSLLGQPGKLEVFQQLVTGYFKGGGMQTQFIIQDKQTLLAAQSHPELYQDLLVRVSGYTAYFCDLTAAMQDEIIARTEDEV